MKKIKNLKFLSLIIGSFVFIFLLGFILDPFGYAGIQPKIIPTHLEFQEAEVLVNDIPAKDGHILKQGEQIEVKKGVDASIIFFDDSISRLQPGTKLRFEILDDAQYEQGSSQVLINLENGSIWSKVQPHTTPDMSFQIKTTSVNGVIRGSAYNVSTDGSCIAQITATEHQTQLILSQEGDPNDGHLFEGEKIIVDACKNTVNISKITPEETLDVWLAINEEKDLWYQKNLQEIIKTQNQLMMGAEPESFSAHFQPWHDRLALLINKKEAQTDILKRTILQANYYFQNGDRKSGEETLHKAETLINDLLKNNISRNAIQKVLTQVRAQLRLVLPENETYDVKNFLQQQSVMVAEKDQKLVFAEHVVEERIIDFYDQQKKTPGSQSIESFKNALEFQYGNYIDVNNKIDQSLYMRTLQDQVICRADTDCPENHFCEATYCQPKPLPQPKKVRTEKTNESPMPCQKDSQCPVSASCVDGFCEAVID